jgi:hypothetical protein
MTRILIFVTVFASILFISCEKDFFENTQEEAYGDALIRVYYNENDSLVFSTEFYAYAFTEMESVSVSSSDTKNPIELDSLSNRYTFTSRPLRESYTSEIPATKSYTFDISFLSGTELKVTDYLTSEYVKPPVFDMFDFNKNTQELNLRWDLDDKVQYYKILVFDPDREIIFETDLLQGFVNSYTLSAQSYGWYASNNKFKAGSQYIIAINAYIFEPFASNFDIQCIATNDSYRIVWE